MKVLVSDNFSRESLDLLEQARGIELLYRPGITRADLLDEIAEVDALAVRSGTLIDEELLEQAEKLRVISRAGIGTENIDMAAANRKGVVVMNTPFGSTITTAEHTIAMLLALARNIAAADRSIRAGEWEKQRFLGVEIAGKTLGVIGAGKIGRLVIERARALQMKVIVHDPYLTEETLLQIGATQVELDQLLEQSDFITLHVPLNLETENLIDNEALDKVKPGCRIINCATGGLIDEQALAAHIKTGRVAGAGIDVFTHEPPEPDNPLLSLEQVICTPHLRAATIDAQINVSVQAVRQLLDFLLHGEITNALNVPSVNAELLEEIRPYVDLSERLGQFQAQYNPRGHKQVTIEYSGSTGQHPISPLTMAVLKGLLTPSLGSMVNFVNAPHLARERGIKVIESRSSESEGYDNLIRVTVEGSEKTSVVSGVMFGPHARIVRVDEHRVEATPTGHMLILHNRDLPGVVGHVGNILSEAKINIAQMNLSRDTENETAISLINVDSKIPEDLIARMLQHEAILSAFQVRLTLNGI
ncbi:MAG: phosphoglycerate dehydrogenase [Desulfuromonas sp.]|nr:MAG: phosphoglycerate dehydrogenase [Desulfuromonas sp.]